MRPGMVDHGAAQHLRDEQPHEPAVELAAGDLAQLGLGRGGGHRDLVGVGRRQDVVDLGDREDPRVDRDVLARQAVGVAVAVDPLVVGEHRVGDLAQALRRAAAGGRRRPDGARRAAARRRAAHCGRAGCGRAAPPCRCRAAGRRCARRPARARSGRPRARAGASSGRRPPRAGRRSGSRSASVSSSSPTIPSWRTSSWSLRRSTSSPCSWPFSSERSSSWQTPSASANRPIDAGAVELEAVDRHRGQRRRSPAPTGRPAGTRVRNISTQRAAAQVAPCARRSSRSSARSRAEDHEHRDRDAALVAPSRGRRAPAEIARRTAGRTRTSPRLLSR